jgi:hypothetical protein
MAFGDWVQGTGKDAGTVSTSNLAFTSVITSGNSVVVVTRRGATSGTITVTDDKSNTYTQDASIIQTTDGHTLFVHRCSNITNGPQTITITFGAGASMRWCQEEYVGNFALHGTPPAAVNTVGNSNPTSGDQVTTVSAAIIGALSDSNTAGNAPFTAGTGYTKRHEANANAAAVTEDKNGAQGAGTHRADGTFSANTLWAAIMCAYSDAGGGGPTSWGRLLGTEINRLVMPVRIT